jgi:hypothetical protein
VRRRRRKHPIAPEAQLGLAWYTRAGWERLRELAVDKDALDDSFEDWERGALVAIGEFKAAGRGPRGPQGSHRRRGARGLVRSSQSTA